MEDLPKIFTDDSEHVPTIEEIKENLREGLTEKIEVKDGDDFFYFSFFDQVKENQKT